jgi:hypothetical protein
MSPDASSLDDEHADKVKADTASIATSALRENFIFIYFLL